ncbi:MAG: proprotein convertase P-domain-containing protein, partial [Saprospiraceae bacterium]|nr:proprotein convertase P-domain-containing protein [Saprospiraceae bacterium]
SESIVHVKTNLTQNTYVPTVTLPINSTLYWRVRPINDCGEGNYLTPFAFHTESFTCTNYNAIGLPVFIGPIGTPTVMATIQIPQPGGVISDINVKKVKASHDYVGDIRLKLRSPSGSEVVLLNQRCANSTNLNLGFDDEAFYNIPCPLTLGLLYRPEEPLTLFDGQTTAGDWKLILEDLHSGSGGQLEEVRLEICSNVSTNGPSLLRNNPLSVRPSLTGYITNNFLEYQDSDSQPQELEFTIVKLPEHGVLKLAGNTLGVGDVFRQFSINAGNVTYTNNGDDATTDYFTFTVNDGQSGFVGTPRFDILIDPNAPVNTNEVTNSTKDIWMIYPNPTTDVLTIKNIGNNNETIDWISCYDAMGRLVGNWKLNDPSDNYTLNIRNLSEGSYYLKVCNSKHNVSIPFIKVNN